MQIAILLYQCLSDIVSERCRYRLLITAPIPVSKETPSAEAQSTRGGKFCDFRLKSPSISETTVQDRPMVDMERYVNITCDLSNGDILNGLDRP